MTNILSKIWEAIKSWFKTLTFKDYILIIAIIGLIICFFMYRHYKNELHSEQMKNSHYNEQFDYYVNKANEAYAALELAILELSDAKKRNDELSEEIKKLKDNPVIITKVKTEFVTDTIYMESERIIERIDSVTNEKSYDLEWRYNEESDYFNIDGSTHVAGDFSSFRTRINKLQVNSDFLFDVVDNGEKLEVLVRSTNPYINVTGMQSVMIDPKQSKTIKQYFKPKRWGLGVQLGVGIDKQLQFTPYIGIGLSYNLIVF